MMPSLPFHSFVVGPEAQFVLVEHAGFVLGLHFLPRVNRQASAIDVENNVTAMSDKQVFMAVFWMVVGWRPLLSKTRLSERSRKDERPNKRRGECL